jgi:N-acetylglucosamine-6-phosphate deacetylase
MIRAIGCDKIVTPSAVVSGFILIEDGKILGVSKTAEGAGEIITVNDGYVMPGFIDIHTHGGGGHAFADSSADEVAMGCDFHLSYGTTTILPTVSASTPDGIRSSLESIKTVITEGKTRAKVIGAHLEGPYLAPEMCGAQCTDFITSPIKTDYDDIIARYGKYIARWTFAPERDEGCEFASALKKAGITGSIGHTSATYDSVSAACSAGTRLVTHLYSCTSTVTRKEGFRSLGVIESTYLIDDLIAEIIADGKHLPPELISMIIKIKGTDKVIAVTDSLSVCGSGITSDTMCGTDFIIEDGVAKLPDRSAFAGSVATADILLRVLVHDCGVSLPDASKMLSYNAARLLGAQSGAIEKGLDADLVVLDEGLKVRSVFVKGDKIF